MSNGKGEGQSKVKDDGIIGGIILIVIGLIALMVTFFDVEIVWSELAKLWPMFIIIFGVSLLPLNKLLKSILVMVVILASCLLYLNETKEDNISEYKHTYTEPAFTNDKEDIDIQEFSESYKNNIKEADVEINYGAGTLHLNSPVAELVKAYNQSDFIFQDFSVMYEDNKADIVFDVERSISVNGNTFNHNDFYIALNENPVYDFEINVGASSIDFDLSEYKVSDIEVNGGACDINIKLGDSYNQTNVSLNTGVSGIKIAIPEDSGCRVECESVLSNRDFKGFIKKSSGVYETPNYSSAENIINIEFDGAVSDFEILRY